MFLPPVYLQFAQWPKLEMCFVFLFQNDFQEGRRSISQPPPSCAKHIMIIDIIYQHKIKQKTAIFLAGNQSFLNPWTQKTNPK